MIGPPKWNTGSEPARARGPRLPAPPTNGAESRKEDQRPRPGRGDRADPHPCFAARGRRRPAHDVDGAALLPDRRGAGGVALRWQVLVQVKKRSCASEPSARVGEAVPGN